MNYEKNMNFEKKDKRTNQSIGQVKLEKPIEVIFEGVDLNTYKVIDKSLPKNIDLSDIKESFCYLFVGHWMQGSFGHDRKNVGVLVKEFYELNYPDAHISLCSSLESESMKIFCNSFYALNTLWAC